MPVPPPPSGFGLLPHPQHFLLVARSMAGDQRDPPQLYLKKAATGDRPLKVLFWQAFYVFTGG